MDQPTGDTAEQVPDGPDVAYLVATLALAQIQGVDCSVCGRRLLGLPPEERRPAGVVHHHVLGRLDLVACAADCQVSEAPGGAL
ncbi:hypothetical protein RM780_03855 [Streptomyces sp. DSM 44917]|uniref:HNH endonuclease n=1 Tax=Streptomyces boetiae TaxID=3075541 RepID=A0ABU2L406_9ACTN|nr:hypothetical protein [Streptomyces sp. DSM 44917]MDT0306097.1 hypothetical protein [Streptomyces sp. DSM 44917]